MPVAEDSGRRVRSAANPSTANIYQRASLSPSLPAMWEGQHTPRRETGREDLGDGVIMLVLRAGSERDPQDAARALAGDRIGSIPGFSPVERRRRKGPSPPPRPPLPGTPSSAPCRRGTARERCLDPASCAAGDGKIPTKQESRRQHRSRQVSSGRRRRRRRTNEHPELLEASGTRELHPPPLQRGRPVAGPRASHASPDAGIAGRHRPKAAGRGRRV